MACEARVSMERLAGRSYGSVEVRRFAAKIRNGKDTGIYETMMAVLATWKQQGCDLPQTLAEALTQEWNKS